MPAQAPMGLHMAQSGGNCKDDYAAMQQAGTDRPPRPAKGNPTHAASYLAAASASSRSFNTVFQLRAVLGTPSPLSNFVPSLELLRPPGVLR